MPNAATHPAIDPDAARLTGPTASFAALVEAMPVAVAVFDAERRMVAANRAFCDLAGLEQGTLSSVTVDTAFPNAIDDLAPSIDAAFRSERRSVRVGFRRGTGDQTVDATFASLDVGGGRRGVVVTGVPVVDRDEAREARLAAVRQLASGVLHDINNVLNPIMAACYLIQTNADNAGAVRDYASRIGTAVELGTAAASRVGRFVRQDPLQGVGAQELVDLSSVVDEVAAMTQQSWSERATGGPVNLEENLSPGVLVHGIAAELRAAVLCLVQNALDAMSAKGGSLGLRTKVADGAAVLEVADSGVGMTSEVRDRAFEPFFTTKGRGSAGLGLAEVYGIAKRHNGRAEIDTAPGRGTTVRLVLPLATAPEARAMDTRVAGGAGTLTR